MNAGRPPGGYSFLRQNLPCPAFFRTFARRMDRYKKRMNNKTTPAELGTESIGKLLRQYALPAIIAMTASSLYNITDSIFIGHGVGALALSGLAICFPLMNLAAAFGSLVGGGGSTLLSIRLGQQDYETGNVILGNVIGLNLIVGIAFSVITLIFLDPILYFFRGKRGDVVVCPAIHAGAARRQCVHAHVHGAEQPAALGGRAEEVDVCHHLHRADQRGAERAVRVRLQVGHQGVGQCHGHRPGRHAGVAVQVLLNPRYFLHIKRSALQPAAEAGGGHAVHRLGTVFHERRRLPYRHCHQPGFAAHGRRPGGGGRMASSTASPSCSS